MESKPYSAFWLLCESQQCGRLANRLPRGRDVSRRMYLSEFEALLSSGFFTVDLIGRPSLVHLVALRWAGCRNDHGANSVGFSGDLVDRWNCHHLVSRGNHRCPPGIDRLFNESSLHWTLVCGVLQPRRYSFGQCSVSESDGSRHSCVVGIANSERPRIRFNRTFAALVGFSAIVP